MPKKKKGGSSKPKRDSQTEHSNLRDSIHSEEQGKVQRIVKPPTTPKTTPDGHPICTVKKPPT